MKEKDFDIQKEKNENEKLTQLYTNENKKNFKLNNQISFFQQIINDKENEINNMRKSYSFYNNAKQSKNGNNNEEIKNKLIEENKTLKERQKDFRKLQFDYNALN